MEVIVDGTNQKFLYRQWQHRYPAAVRIRRQKSLPGLPFPGGFLLPLQLIDAGSARGV